jgi:hypothetical protein
VLGVPQVEMSKSILDISEKYCRADNPYPWNVSTRVSSHAHLILVILEDVYLKNLTYMQSKSVQSQYKVSTELSYLWYILKEETLKHTQ